MHTTLGLSNVSLRPQAGGPPRAQLACSCTSASRPASTRPSCTPRKIMPLNRIPDEQREVCLDLICGPAPAPRATTRCSELLDRVRAASRLAARGRTAEDRADWTDRAAACASASSTATATASSADLDAAMAEGLPPLRHHQRRPAGRHEGRSASCSAAGEMQLPFVLQSAETMKTAVAYLEPHMEKVDGGEQGPHRAGHRQGRRPRHRQEPGRHHPHQQRLRGRTTSASRSRSPR